MANPNIVRCHKITAGPSKYDLMLALFDATGDGPRPVVFNADGGLCGPGPYTVHVTSVEREDGSGESWNVRGLWYSQASGRTVVAKIYFSTRQRSGSISFAPQ